MKYKMLGYVIHLAVGKVYLKHNQIEDVAQFEEGIIAPDLSSDKSKSHYGQFSSSPDLNKFINEKGIDSSYLEGYFLHLLTDYLFYNRFLKSWDSSLYTDYNKLNRKLIQKYGIVVPKEIRGIVKFEDGMPDMLDEQELYQFIESVGNINVRQIVLQRERNIQNIIDQEYRSE